LNRFDGINDSRSSILLSEYFSSRFLRQIYNRSSSKNVLRAVSQLLSPNNSIVFIVNLFARVNRRHSAFGYISYRTTMEELGRGMSVFSMSEIFSVSARCCGMNVFCQISTFHTTLHKQTRTPFPTNAPAQVIYSKRPIKYIQLSLEECLHCPLKDSESYVVTPNAIE
jgi:hypothetical protein